MAERAAIPLVDLTPLHARLRAEIDAAIAGVLDGGRFVLGAALAAFETQAAEYLGARHAIGVANGTDALLLALRAAGVRPNDEVITSAFTFFATIEAIVHAGATPVFADIEPGSMNLGPQDVARRITPRTRALLPVHLFGQAADMPALAAIARAHGLIVIEDAAQAFGANVAGRMAGTFGLAGCFSFHPTKPLGALGDGGMIVTADDELAARLRRLRDHGARGRHEHVDVGFNSRLDDLHAAVLGVKLRHLDAHLADRERLAATYRKLLADLPLQLPEARPGSRHTQAQFTLRTQLRDELQRALHAAGIGSAVHYPQPGYRQPAIAARFDAAFRLPVTEAACAQCLSLPLYQGLTMVQQQYIAEVIAGTLDGTQDRQRLAK